MTEPWLVPWARRQTVVVTAFEDMVERVRRRVPELVARNGSSTNIVKPIHVVRSFALPGKQEDALVLSTMFTFFGGSLKVHCDLMKEDGPILRDLGSRDLGAEPADEEIDAAVESVVTFVASSEEEIVTGLDAQRSDRAPLPRWGLSSRFLAREFGSSSEKSNSPSGWGVRRRRRDSRSVLPGGILMTARLPKAVRARILSFPEYNIGVHKVALIMKDGSVIEDVLVAWGDEVVRVGEEGTVPFGLGEVIDAQDRS